MCTLLGHSCDITQLACVAENESFNRFVLSIAPITASATAGTGLRVVNWANVSFITRKRLRACPLKGVKKFCEWLNQFNNPLLVSIRFNPI